MAVAAVVVLAAISDAVAAVAVETIAVAVDASSSHHS